MNEFVKGLHHVGMPTADMGSTVAFYQSFGAKITYEKKDEYDGHPIRVVLMNFGGVLIECYERPVTEKRAGAIEHLAFEVERIEEMYSLCKEKGYRLMEDCAQHIGESTYWPEGARWFIVYGPNEEKIEFCREG